MRKSLLIIVFFYVCWNIFSQFPDNLRLRQFRPDTLKIVLDTLSIIPGTVKVFINSDIPLHDSLFSVNHSESTIKFHPEALVSDKELTIQYRVYSLSFSMEYYLRDTMDIFLKEIQRASSGAFKLGDSFLFEQESKLVSSGSISRGITIGNRQDVVFNSQLNLQLSGKLTDQLNIEAIISDNNIPLQPEGYSQRIQEFDKVYISVYDENLRLTAGDFDLTDQRDYYLRMNRKAQGVMFSGQFKSKGDTARVFETSLSGSVAKGRFATNNITAAEGNQGPYRLRGENNELYIIVLAGSERVFVDGRLLTRGLEHDYVIDYNLAEIVFTANQPINRNKRILVEFEYSDRNYPRFMTYTKNRFTKGNTSVYFGFYNEQDAKNQPLQQLLSMEQRNFLASVGDSLHLAYVPKIDSTEFSNSLVLYRRTDSLVNTILYNDVYIYSTDPDKAQFRLSFTFLGENKGNYVPDISSANGRVYRWVAPENGIPQGTHEPLIFLVTPKKQQLISFGIESNPGESARFLLDAALSQNDVNTYSRLNSEDNTGIAFRVSAEKTFFSSDTAGVRLKTGVGYELTGYNFRTAERFRPVEFERDWNLRLAELSGNQHHVFGEAGLYIAGDGNILYKFDFFQSGGFEGFRNSIVSRSKIAGFQTNLAASYLTTHDFPEKRTDFFRHHLDISRKTGPMVAGIFSESENNAWKAGEADSLLINSFKNSDIGFYLTNLTEQQNTWRIEGRQRRDFLPSGDGFEFFSLANEISGGLSLTKNQLHVLKTRINLRSVNYMIRTDSVENENSFSGRIEYSDRYFRGSLILNTYVETISGREQAKEFFYLEVPAGQGIYKWVDYNGNGIKELDEFEIAGFPDEADHIRVFLPTNIWVKTRINQIGQTIQLQPGSAWRNEGGWKGVVARFSNQASFRTMQKIENGSFADFMKILHTSMDDASLVNLNANLRNTFSFNRSSQKFGADYILLRNWSKVLLVNGADKREIYQHTLRLRWSPFRSFILYPVVENIQKLNSSEYFPSRNYHIRESAMGTTLEYQSELKLQMKLVYRLSAKNNKLSVEKALLQEAKLESIYSMPGNFQLNAHLRYMIAEYNSPMNTSVAFEMLEGLFPGRNILWSLYLQKSLPNNLEITLNYNGRASKGRDVIHTGGLQARAYF